MALDGRARPLTVRLEAARRNRYKVIHRSHLFLLWAIGAEGCEAHLEPVDASDTFWAAALCIHSPAGQLTFKLTKEDAKTFEHLPKRKKACWDGHSHADNMQRLEQLARGVHA